MATVPYPQYKTGTVSVANDSVNVTGDGTLVQTFGVKPGDLFVANGLVGLIEAVTDKEHWVLASPWIGTSIVDGAYVIQLLPRQTGQTQDDLRNLLASLAGMTPIYYVTGSVPDPDIGENSQFAIKFTAGSLSLWEKVDDEWIARGVIAGEDGEPGEPGDPGEQGLPGNDGDDGWSPILSIVDDGSRKVLQVEWVGGAGVAPSPDGWYIGVAGFVENIGDAVAVRSNSFTGKITVSNNAGSPPALPNLGDVAHFVGADGANSRVYIDLFRNGAVVGPVLIFRSANGTAAAPSATLSGDNLGQISAFGYGATGYINSGKASIFFAATENWTDAATGAEIRFFATRNGTTANTIYGKISPSAIAGETSLMIWDNDNGQLERVTVGAADSGGTGFKVLRIPN